MSSSSSFRLLDLFCCEGLAHDGYVQAGFSLVGIDIERRPNYPSEFWQMDALSLNYEDLAKFDAIHASPPCQAYAVSTAQARAKGRVYPDLYRETKRMLVASGLPFIIENVRSSPIRGGLCLCGTMFNMGVFRHRVFESNFQLVKPALPCTCGQHSIDEVDYFTVGWGTCTKAQGLRAMGVTRNVSEFGAKEGVPPAYTKFIGDQLREFLLSGSPVKSAEQMCTQVPHLVQEELFHA